MKIVLFTSMKKSLYVAWACFRNVEKYIFEIAQVFGENVPIAFLYVLSILLVQFGLLSGYLLGNSYPLG